MVAELRARLFALLGRFLPRLGPLVNSGGLFFCTRYHSANFLFAIGARTMAADFRC